MSVSRAGSVSDCREAQPSNASAPMRVTVPGMEMVRRLVQS